uniref:Putative phosphatidylserine decarboxylase n=1 Tax=Anopheles darlingi TaxID=43151 RepID=A0A2M4CVK6_ANODA
MPRNRLFSKAVNLKPNPKQWTTRWTIVQRTIYGTNRQQQQQQHHHQNPSSTNQTHQENHHHHHHQQQTGSSAAGGWLTWRGVFLRWTPISICMVVAAKWHLHNRDLDKKGLPRTAAKWQRKMYCSLPLRFMSRCWGWVADRKVPTPARPVVYGLYSHTFGVKMEEAASADFK